MSESISGPRPASDIRYALTKIIEIFVVQIVVMQDRLTKLEEEANYSMETELGSTGKVPELEKEEQV